MPVDTEPHIIVISNFADQLIFTGESLDQDCGEYFRNCRSWEFFHQQRFANNADKVNAFKYMLSRAALLWWNTLPMAQIPATLDALRDLF